MSASSISAIGAIKPVDAGTNVELAQAQPAPAASPKINAASQEKLQVQTRGEHAQAGMLSNVSIHFRVDQETNDVTIFIVDRKSRKVLRSIPANELEKLKIGELLKLTA